MVESKSPRRRFLFVWWEGGGNMPPALELVRQLVARGHAVHALCDACSEAAFLAAGASFAAYRRAPSRLDLSPEADTMKDWEAHNPAQTIAILRERLMCGPALAYAQDTLDQIERFHPDALVVMDATFGAMIAGQSAGVPTAAVAPHILVYPVPGRPTFGPGLLPARNMLQRLRDRVLLSVVNRWMNKGLPQLNAARKAIGLAPAPTVFETLRADRLLVLTTPALELPGGPLPDNVRYTGPILVDPDWAQPWTSPWREDDERPLVLVGFSSTFQDQTAALRTTIAALGRLPVRALVTTGPGLRGVSFAAPANVVVCESAPHNAVLPTVSVMVTHAGHGSVIRALAHDVPLICLPMGRDQNDIAARVVYHGAGLRLSPKATDRAIETAVRRVLSEPRFKESAARLGAAVRRAAGPDAALAELEALASRRSAVASPKNARTAA
jgi:MGT family glycosyltransferase